MRNFIPRSLASALLALAAFTPVLRADDLSALRDQLKALEQKILALERKQALTDEAALAAGKIATKITAADGRVEIASVDGANALRLRGLVQADYRWYDAANAPADTFLVRRARLILEGKFNSIFSYVLQPELSGTVQILDASVNAAISPAFNVRVGKFKVPVGLEQLQSDPVAFFNERSVASGLTPVRDVGLQIQGDLFGQTVSYAIALLNGVPDGASSSGTDFDADKTIAARLFATPFVNDKDSFLSGLGVGVAVSTGDYGTASGRSAGYRTDGQQTWFTYLTSTTGADNVVAAGAGLTVSPQGYFYRGPFGLLAEYVISSIDLQRGVLGVREVKNHAYHLSAGWVLSGEANSYRGVTPKTVFNPSAGTWGAFEIVGRVAGVDIDDTTFGGAAATRLANPSTSATQLTTYALGLNWFLSRSIRAGFNLYRNEFTLAPGAAPAASALISDEETSFISRLQVAF